LGKNRLSRRDEIKLDVQVFDVIWLKAINFWVFEMPLIDF